MSGCAAFVPAVKRGDAYHLRLTLALGGEDITAEDLPLLHCVEFMLGGGIRKVWPADGAFADGVFLIPLTQADTFSLDDGTETELDVRVHLVSGPVVGLRQRLRIKVLDALSEVVL